MLVADMRLQIFSEANDFCFITLIELSASLNDTAVMGLLLTESDINHITKIDSHLNIDSNWDLQHIRPQRLHSS